MQKERQESFCLLLSSPNTYNSQVWARQKLGLTNSSFPIWAAAAQVLRPSSCATSGCIRRKLDLQQKNLDSPRHSSVECAHSKCRPDLLCHKAHPQTRNLGSKNWGN